MTIVLHIGVSKTGSSAIQYGLAEHQRALSRLGVHYALDEAEALVRGRLVASGNGAALARALNPHPNAEYGLTAAEFDAAYVSADHPISLISSESLSAARPELLQRFRDEVIGTREVRIVAFARDLYGHAVSSWMQRIKRHGYTGQFAHFCAKAYTNKQCSALHAYAEAFAVDRIQVIHYDGLAGTPFRALLGALDLPDAGMADPPRINRSLSKAEVEVLIACNQAHKNQGELSARISDHLIYKHPERPTDSVRSAAAARTLAERFGDEVDWINATFFSGEPRLKVGEGAPSSPTDETARAEVWADAIEALGRRLVSAEAQNRKLQAAAEAFKTVQDERAYLLAELARLKGQSWVEKLKLDVARRIRRPAGRDAD